MGLIAFLMRWTEPSPKRVLAPPGCRLRDPEDLPHSCAWSLQLKP